MINLSLSQVCSYSNEKMDKRQLTLENYISTENMLQNKCGVVKSSGLPSLSQTQAYSIGDVLVSNIRPYFKKIWFATKNGGCSNDVLVFKSKQNCYNKYLYYVLSDDNFFDYATQTAKGTKMPRGDKSAIMEYKLKSVPLEIQKKIAKILSSIDDKIEFNNKINDNLVA